MRGIPLRGWDWSRWEKQSEEAAGVRWGEFTVTGRYDGEVLVVEDVRPGSEPAAGQDPGRDFSTPCPAPAGGWRVIDPATTTEATMNRVFRVAARLEGYADAWVDQSLNPVTVEVIEQAAPEDRLALELALNDPELTIVNVRVTGDLEEAERELRSGWGGMLCVSRARRTEAELGRIQSVVNRLPGMLSSSSGFDVVEVHVLWDDGSLQEWADATYGAGVVRVSSALVTWS